MQCIFCTILENNLNNIIFENSNIYVIKDINPKSDVHILFITKKHIESLNDIDKNNSHIMQDLIESIPIVANILSIKEYKIMINCGRSVGQEIMHIHAHLQS